MGTPSLLVWLRRRWTTYVLTKLIRQGKGFVVRSWTVDRARIPATAICTWLQAEIARTATPYGYSGYTIGVALVDQQAGSRQICWVLLLPTFRRPHTGPALDQAAAQLADLPVDGGTHLEVYLLSRDVERAGGAHQPPIVAPGAPAACAACGAPGKPVAGQTVKALLAVSLRMVADGDYLFCSNPTCPVVYFARDHAHAFTTDQLREQVYQKVPDDPDVWICYCFRHTVGDVQRASVAGRDAIVADITAGIQAGQCACDLRNPQGACCLANVRAVVKQAETPGCNGAAPQLLRPRGRGDLSAAG